MVIAADGSETTTATYFNSNGTQRAQITTTISFDGRTTTVRRSDGVVETTTRLADASGSYSWVRTAADHTLSGYASHTIEAAGVDTWTWNEHPTVAGSPTPNSAIRIDLATKTKYLDIAARLYDTAFDRDRFISKREFLAKYIVDGVLNTTALANDLIGGMLVVTDGTHTANIPLLGNYLTSTFVPSNNGHGGTSVVDPPAVLLNQDLASSLSGASLSCSQEHDPTDAGLTQLVQAMAVYSGQDPGFNPATASQAPKIQVCRPRSRPHGISSFWRSSSLVP
jgi:hypothetical protein